MIHSSKIQTSLTMKTDPPQKVDQFFRNFSAWTEPDPLSFGPKFPEILVEWIAPIIYTTVIRKKVKELYIIKR